MEIIKKFKEITKPKFQLDPKSYVEGYEDEDHPCYNCIVKGICTVFCQDMWNYGADIKIDMNRLAKKWLPERKLKRQESLVYSTDNLMRILGTLKGHQAENLFHDDEMHESMQRAQAHLNRKKVIRKNYVNKFGVQVSSSTHSGVSSSSASLSPSLPERKDKRQFPKPIKNLNRRAYGNTNTKRPYELPRQNQR